MLVREAEEIARFTKYYCPDTARRAKERLLACQDDYYNRLTKSIDRVELIIDFENEFNITIDDNETENINTVGNAIDYINKLV